MNIPEELNYTDSHEWIDTRKDPIVTVGITDHAQSELSELVYVELPSVGIEVTRGDSIAVVESVKAASDIYAPVSGEIVAINTKLEENPAVLNKDPYGKGWLFKIKLSDPSDLDDLLDHEAYADEIG
jgi:glycine cleavage system H protein